MINAYKLASKKPERSVCSAKPRKQGFGKKAPQSQNARQKLAAQETENG